MNIKYILAFLTLSLFPVTSMSAVFNQTYVLTDNSYYSNNFLFFGDIVTNTNMLTGLLNISIDDNFITTIDYSNVLLNGSQFRPNDTLLTDLSGVASMTLTSGFTGDPDYMSYGNATLSPFPTICVECGYEMALNLGANPNVGSPLLLSYHENNPFDTGEVHFELFVSQVPLPSAVWLFASGLIGIVSLRRHKKHITIRSS